MNAMKFLIGGFVAFGCLCATTGQASAQYVQGYTAFGQPIIGNSYVAPSGGIVTRSAAYNPYINSTIVSKSYVNPYSGVAFQKQYVAPGVGNLGFVQPGFGNYSYISGGFVNPVYTQPVYTPPLYRPGFVYPGAGFGYIPSVGYSTIGVGYRSNNFSIGLSFGRFR